MKVDEAKAFARKHKNILILVAIVAVGAIGYIAGTAKDRCTDRGIEYFKEIGSYPNLSDGRSSAKVAAERCARTTGAF